MKWMDTRIKTRVLTYCCFVGSGEKGVMKDVKRDNVCIKWIDTCIKTKVLIYCCAGSGKRSVKENAKRDKCVNKVDGKMHKNKSTY